MAETPLERLQRIQSLDTVSNQIYTSPLERLQQIQINREDYTSPLERLQQIQYGYPESSLKMEDEEYYGNLAMGDKELKEQQGVGFWNSLLHGVGSGATLGHIRRLGVEPLDDKAMTTAEMGAEVVGELAGGLLPFIGASAIMGTVGAPVAVAGGAMAASYKAIKSLGKGQKLITRLTKNLSKLEKQQKTIGKVGLTTGKPNVMQRELINDINRVKQRINNVSKINLDNANIVRESQRQYTKKLAEQNTAASLRELKRLSKVPKTAEGLMMPATSGSILRRVPGFNSSVKKVAETYGYKGAQVLNKFANNIGTFAAVGMVADKPGYDFADRLKDVPKDVLMGSLFAVSGLPSMYGKAGATLVEPMAMYGLGAYSDYLTGEPNPNMSAKERMIHGLSLVAFHEVGQRMPNWFAKEKMYRGLIEMGWNPEVAIKTIYGNKSTDTIISKARDIHQKRGTLMFNRENPSDVIAIIGATGAEKSKETVKLTKSKQRQKVMTEEKEATISYRNLITGELFTVEGKTMAEAAKKINEN